ncbi:cytochrome c [Roseivivax halotolerans]|jgi:cytochrome c|uniref:Cytochrome c n=1 Tax=Roseivivax halotolerans TaxID=93684 RepID=A0A1I5WMV9_9RHOB|nr:MULTISPECIES: c-type cytochrome [Roseivivax]QFT64349.1 Cytochrome c-553 precursor [Roseivivax sp. THAF30]SFQ21142.1 cytochrome c [Roseivivax halotolerans]
MRGGVFTALCSGAVTSAQIVLADQSLVHPEIAEIMAIEADADYGAYLASECTACHSPNPQGAIPQIHMLPESYIVGALVDYRIGERQHQVMETIAKRLGEEEIAALAKYFSEVE